MNTLLDRIFEKSEKAIKNWWLMLIAGIALFVLGIVVFFNPGGSYLAFSILFGVVMLGTGIAQLVIAIADKNYFTTRGWMIVAGILDIILGVILCANIGLSAMTLPFILGFWLMYRGFLAIGLGSDMSTLRFEGSTLTIIMGVLQVVLAFLVLFQPLVGASMIVVFLGLAFLMAGVNTCYMAWQLRSLHVQVKKLRGSK
ncbi:DUF308 domain-containing protein [Bacteroidales bacterium OttesenSCG-928-B11]|nr:DUF308 domain-containing protein [Bacteroidales bacterium OttesenSCG-928-E04]MDL2308173.1 DUF308 domain-containing protein [Bacteroidales bacterium OttesenSCG-928-C03]MDL2311559.1 DUF308 domain-containing protein [Bacteroidales bacterium OttesenSCG-928-B11]MDL2325612.1 DUF308 domain-containing protein [Bacteroidales bacterium OttesenSCG-928-A14]